jgi:AraC-like DNA-binding protein
MSSSPRFLGPGGKTGTFTVDAGTTGTGRGTWESFINTWNDHIGDLYPLPEFSAPTIAAHLHVSVRTLQRAFATLGESFSAYIHRRRLEEAATALTAPGSRLTVSEAAALWHFTDSSHFIRAFKKRYGATPARFARRPA